MSEVPLYTPGTYHQNIRLADANLFRGGLLFKAHRLLYHSTLGLRVIKKKKKTANLVLLACAGYGSV